MTGTAELADVPWSTKALTVLGFSPADAARLAPLLPPIEVGILVQAELRSGPLGWRPNASPAATILWFSHDLGWRDSRDLARMGRGVLDLIVILDAVRAIMPSRTWDRHAIDVACEWASERTVPRNRIGAYIRAGLHYEEAAQLEAEPSTRPSVEELQLLAALRTGGPVAAYPTSIGRRR